MSTSSFPGQQFLQPKGHWHQVGFKVKANQTYKARLVAQGWNQVPGQDCGSTFAPVCGLQSVRKVLAIAAEMDWKVRQLDVKTAFLYADIEEEVFLAEPPGVETNDNE